MGECLALGMMGWCLGLDKAVPVGVASLPSFVKQQWDSLLLTYTGATEEPPVLTVCVQSSLGCARPHCETERSRPRVPVPGQFGAVLVLYNLS